MAVSITFRYSLVLLLLLVGGARCVVGPNDPPPDRSIRRGAPPLCPPACDCSVTQVSCEGWAGADPLPSLARSLSLTRFPHAYFPSSVLAELTQLRWLRVSDGALLTPPILPALPALASLDLSANRIRALPPAPFAPAPHLRHLNLSRNALAAVTPDDAFDLAHLRQLDLSHNPRLRLPAHAFRAAHALRYLDLSATGLEAFPARWASDLPQLTFLNVSGNRLAAFAPSALAALRVLDVSRNPLPALPPLRRLPALVALYAARTLVSDLRAVDTEGCGPLQLLDLGGAWLRNVNEGVLGRCAHLTEIDLSANDRLWRVEHGALGGLTALAVLRLNDCPALVDIEPDALNGLHALRELHLQRSGLKVLPESLSRLTNLTVLHLEHTALLCDCHAHALPDLLRAPPPGWRGVDVIECADGVDRTPAALAAHLEALSCLEVEMATEEERWTLAPWGADAVLACNATGTPTPTVVWQSVDHRLHVLPNRNRTITEPWLRHELAEALKVARAEAEGKFEVVAGGGLLVRGVTRNEIGRYKCFAFNAVSNATLVAFLGLDDSAFRVFIIESVLFGLACAGLFLLVTLTVQLIRYLMERFGWECCCCKNRLSPKAKQIRQLIESVESYKTAQLEKLRENYTSQVTNIKDSCYQQMERLRDSYAHQSKNLKDLCDYSTQQITGARDQYLDQVNKVRDYSISQMNRVRENYVFQRHRIRKFSGHQLLRLRETYKYQQKTLNKLLETLPDLYIQNCRTGSCQRTDSIIFDNEIDGLDVYYKVDFLDSHSNTSDYYTPNSTLTRQSKGARTNLSRNASSVSGGTEYQEAHSWVVRQESNGSADRAERRFHGRSFSIATPPSGVHGLEGGAGHKRSVSSSSHYSPHQLHLKAPLLEEAPDVHFTPPRPRSLDAASSRDTSVYTPLTLTPVHDASPIAPPTGNPAVITDKMGAESDKGGGASDEGGGASDKERPTKDCDSKSAEAASADDAAKKVSYETSM